MLRLWNLSRKVLQLSDTHRALESPAEMPHRALESLAEMPEQIRLSGTQQGIRFLRRRDAGDRGENLPLAAEGGCAVEITV